MKIISKDSPLPLHYQLKEILLEMIENEELKPGDLIPAERELCEVQGISRMTVNKAILSLVSAGVLYREQGKGTFVSQPKHKQQLSRLSGFTEDMKQQGYQTGTRVLSFRIMEPTKQTKHILQMKENENEVIELTRLRMREKEPIALETAWIPLHLCPDLSRELVEGHSLYQIFEQKYKLHPEKATQSIEPTALNEYEAQLLNQNTGALALMFRRTTFVENEKPIEYTKSIYRSDIYKYEVTLK